MAVDSVTGPEITIYTMAVASASQQITVAIILPIRKEATGVKSAFSALKEIPCPHFLHRRLFGDLHSYMSEKQELLEDTS